MTGLEAISTHNGWSIALVGISIVFTGLTLLALTISRLYKILDLWEDRDRIIERLKERRRPAPQAPDDLADACPVLPDGMQETARHFKLLSERLEEPFTLPELLDLGIRCGLTRPHKALNDLILAGIVVPNEDGFYEWNKRVTP